MWNWFEKLYNDLMGAPVRAGKAPPLLEPCHERNGRQSQPTGARLRVTETLAAVSSPWVLSMLVKERGEGCASKCPCQRKRIGLSRWSKDLTMKRRLRAVVSPAICPCHSRLKPDPMLHTCCRRNLPHPNIVRYEHVEVLEPNTARIISALPKCGEDVDPGRVYPKMG